jgi:hypothetical protein
MVLFRFPWFPSQKTMPSIARSFNFLYALALPLKPLETAGH